LPGCSNKKRSTIGRNQKELLRKKIDSFRETRCRHHFIAAVFPARPQVLQYYGNDDSRSDNHDALRSGGNNETIANLRY
jgi:hypothetical protein